MPKIDEETRRFLFEKKKSNRDKINDLRQSLEKDLEDECFNLTGHDWWGWSKTFYEVLSYEHQRYQLIRRCVLCDKTECKEIPEEVERLKKDYGIDI